MTGWVLQYKAAHSVSIYRSTNERGLTRWWPVCSCRWNDNPKRGTKTFSTEEGAKNYARENHWFDTDLGILTLQREWYG